MNAVVKLFRLPRSEKKLLAEALVLLSAVRIGLVLVSVQQLHRALKAIRRGTSGGASDRQMPLKANIAVSRAARIVPRATCLSQALTLQAMLRRESLPSSLWIGVSKDEAKRFGAHAWVEHDGTVFPCGTNPSLFTPLAVLKSA